MRWSLAPPFIHRGLVVAIGALAFSGLARPSEPCPAGGWVEAAPTPVALSRYGFAQNGDSFYVIGAPQLRRYDAVADSWTTLAPMPRPARIPGAAYHGGKLYVAGGHDDGLMNEFFIYDIATNAWSTGPALPMFSYGSAAAVFDEKLFVVVGTSWQSLAIFDFAMQSWTIGPSVPTGCRLAGWTQAGPYLYLIGGLGNGCNTTSRRLDMSSVSWSTGPAWTPARGDFALAANNGKLYAMGGRVITDSLPSAEVWELDTASWPSGTWIRRMPDLPSPREANQAGFSTAGRIWSTGGYGAGQVPTLENISLVLDGEDGDGDGAGAACDCDDGDPGVWSTPGDVEGVLASKSGSDAILTWAANVQGGATSVAYDTLRSSTASDFVTSSGCVETNDDADLTATDSIVPPSGDTVFYVVRSRNGCPGSLGTGSAGTMSSGLSRAARSCP